MVEISAGGVVYRHHPLTGRVQIQLIVDRFEKISLAKGKMEAGETVEQTALREIVEETGIRGKMITPLARIEYEYKKADGEKIDKAVHYFLVEALSGELQTQIEEINETAWYEPAEAWKLQRSNGYANNDLVLRKAFAQLGLGTIFLPSFVDHTCLKPTARSQDILKLCTEAREFGFYSVCVNSCWIDYCQELLQGSGVLVGTVCGFPLGASDEKVKVFEAQEAANAGAKEVDMVINIGMLLEGRNAAVAREISRVVEAVRGQAIVKVILETCFLTDDQKQTACLLAEQAGAHFVKTSTGFGPAGATVEDVRFMRAAVSPHIGVKAAGGIRDLTTAIDMLDAGADRLGMSSAASLLTVEAKDR